MYWPTPPFYEMDANRQASVPGCACVVELQDGQLVDGKLEQFDPDMIVIKTVESEELTAFNVERIRMIKVSLQCS